MAVSFDQEANYVNEGDSAEIKAFIYDELDAPVLQADLTSVDFIVQKPDGTKTTTSGAVIDNGTGSLRFTDTDLVGQYLVVAQFTFDSGQVKSSRADFEVIDPFNPPVPSTEEVIGALVWRKIEDCFDAEDEGPWLRDQTLNYFNRAKMGNFISEALFDINQQNPPTQLTDTYFINNGTPTADAPLLVEGTFIAVILHLLASYTEQPNPLGGQVVYEDRRDYVQRWLQVYQVEMQRYMRWLALWKRQFLGLGHTKGIVATKAGRLLPAPLRVTTVGRGYY